MPIDVTINFNHADIKSSASLQRELTNFNNGQNFDGLEHFSYNNSGFVNLLFGHLESTNFDGITVSNHSNCTLSNPKPKLT